MVCRAERNGLAATGAWVPYKQLVTVTVPPQASFNPSVPESSEEASLSYQSMGNGWMYISIPTSWQMCTEGLRRRRTGIFGQAAAAISFNTNRQITYVTFPAVVF